MKYESLINKKILLLFNGNVSNSFQIKEMVPTTETVKGHEGRGFLHKCKVEWEKKMPGAPDNQEMGFDEQTLNELFHSNEAECPGLPTLKYKIEDDE